MADLDFVVGQKRQFPVGMERRSAPEFRRRVLAGALSYHLQLSSIDYTLKRYVKPGLYDDEELLLGDKVSYYLRDTYTQLKTELRNLHSKEPTFGIFGAELTLYRVPHSLDTARMLANRGLLLEVLPILRLCLEMIAWSNVAFYTDNEDKVVALNAPSCISMIKDVYKTAGRIYGYLSKFSHWGHVIHSQFLEFESDQTWVLNASVRYRAMALALCLVVLDVFVEVIRNLYPEKNQAVVALVHGSHEGADRKTYRLLSNIADVTKLEDVNEIRSLIL